MRQALDTLQIAAPMLFLLCVLYPSMRYVQNEQIVSLSTMDLSLAWRAAAMPAGILLMLASVLLRVRRPAAAELAGVMVLLLATGAMLLLGPTLRHIGNYNLLVFFLGIAAVTVLSGIPIAFAFGLSTLGYLALSTRIPLSVLVARMDAGMSHPVLLSIPLFVFLGLLIEMTGMAAVIVGFLSNLLGHVRGGLSYVLIAAMYLVSGISGSKAADMAAIAPALFPEMVKRGIPRGELVALLAATGAQTETIPPSLILITIGSVTGISIAALFAGGLVPGIAGGVFLGMVVWWRARRGDNVAPRCQCADNPAQPGDRPAGAGVAVRDPRRQSSRAWRPRPRSPRSASSTPVSRDCWCIADSNGPGCGRCWCRRQHCQARSC